MVRGAPCGGQARAPTRYRNGTLRALGRTDGAPFDPWLRTHWRAGGELLGVCPASMEIAADVASWEAWTGLRFPESGPYVVPDALVPLEIDRERDLGRYVEPNVWLRHRCGANLPT